MWTSYYHIGRAVQGVFFLPSFFLFLVEVPKWKSVQAIRRTKKPAMFRGVFDYPLCTECNKADWVDSDCVLCLSTRNSKRTEAIFAILYSCLTMLYSSDLFIVSLRPRGGLCDPACLANVLTFIHQTDHSSIVRHRGVATFVHYDHNVEVGRPESRAVYDCLP